MENAISKSYMMQALKLAEKGRYTVSPNPMVGCVIVKNNRVVGTGYHRKVGLPHAEIYALEEAGENAKGATVFITLEPCANYGRTPPCVTSFISADISKIFIACLDPNPLVCNKGVEALRSAAIKVEIGLCEQEAQELNKIFVHYIQKKQPFVIAKWAMSLDGKTITHPKDSRQISSVESQHHAHQNRLAMDAILVGANTIRFDDPQLTVRFVAEPFRQPVRIVLSTEGNLSRSASVFNSSLPGKTILVSKK